MVGCRRGERNGDCGRDGIVAIPEVLVEDLSADTGAGDDVADRQRVDRTFVCERERRHAQAGADPFGAGVGTVGSCCHASSVCHFVDN